MWVLSLFINRVVLHRDNTLTLPCGPKGSVLLSPVRERPETEIPTGPCVLDMAPVDTSVSGARVVHGRYMGQETGK